MVVLSCTQISNIINLGCKRENTNPWKQQDVLPKTFSLLYLEKFWIKMGFFLVVHKDFYSSFTSKFIDVRYLAYSNSSVGEGGIE